jgi:predicted N-acetyltransferase YhbS
MITARTLLRDESDLVWNIDRREVIDNIYYFENGALVLKPEHYDMQGWPPGGVEKYTPILRNCFDSEGWFYGLFDDARLVAVAVLEGKFIGKKKDKLQLEFLHVSREYRNIGLGRQLFELAKVTARERGARRLYVSATPSENTVNFYLRLGCIVTPEPDPELFALEPEDIHMECDL